ncbi:DUF6228 family protein [Kineosporia rhizophila]|uniref:DUF6228 family protein n=1 Tax=Kineosporia rhizophila TaxID=84633 RepID=UPI000A569F5A|nr:DUF6228 family protein [Kineosporia rhizophila]MCE0535456.1 DUF6228 family protein [Kineosporia rhizophila]
MQIRAEGDVVLHFEKDYPWGPDDPAVAGLRVRASGPFVQVDVQVVLLQGEGPSSFLRSLYEDFRGWDGERTWSPHGGGLQITATHTGWVQLAWALSHVVLGEPVWSFQATSQHAAGEDMRRLAEVFDETLDWPA